jgi:hypothetical protein
VDEKQWAEQDAEYAASCEEAGSGEEDADNLEECPEHGEVDVVDDHAAYPEWDMESGVQLLVTELSCGCWKVSK